MKKGLQGLVGTAILVLGVFAGQQGVDAQSLQAGTIERPPFATLQDDQWTGYSIEVAEEVASRQGWQIDWQEKSVFADIITAVRDGQLSFAAANISATSEREAVMDFTVPIYDSGLQIFTPASAQSQPFYKVVWESGIIKFVGLAFLILLGVSHLVWFFERNGEDNKGQDYFRDEYKGGIWDAFWWAFIIATIGGFENERPERPFGRVVAVMWVLASIFFISAFTAKITTSLTVSQLQSDIAGYEDLRGRSVGAPRGTTISKFLDARNIDYIEYDDFAQVVEDVEAEVLDAGVGDAPVVQFYAAGAGRGKIALAGEVFAPDSIAIALPEGSELQEAFDRSLLEMKEDGTLATIRTKYFGD